MALISNPSEAQAAVEAVRQMGLSTALDDFGVGFSSLKHLREIAFDRLKLDRSFVQGISDNRRSQVFVGAIIDLARKLGLTVVVEGVEDIETADTLARLGCDYGQGYLYGRPAPADAARPAARCPCFRGSSRDGRQLSPCRNSKPDQLAGGAGERLTPIAGRSSQKGKLTTFLPKLVGNLPACYR